MEQPSINNSRDYVAKGLPDLLKRLWRYGLVLSRDPVMAEELVQATCLRALEKCAQFQLGTLDRWTFTILSSIWKNELRSRSVRTGQGVIDAELALVSDGAAQIEMNIFASQVLKEVQALPEAQRTAVFLVYGEGLSYREAAAVLDVPEGTIMSRLATARTKLGKLKEDSEFVKHWGKRDIRKISKPDVTLIIDGIVTRGSPSAANHALAAIRRLFNWAVERGVIDFSPCQGLKPPGKLKSRERVLSDDELVAIWNAASSEAYPFGTITQLLMLTGQRRGEVIAMRWQDLDLTHSVWSLPGDLNKSGRAHEIPLTPSAVIILRQLPRLHEVLVFPANRKGTDNPVSGIGKAKQRIEKCSDVADWRLHDIRRTVATGMARLKITPHVVEKVLNHSSGTFSGVAGVYNRFGYLPEMREALEAWEAHLTSLLET